MSAVIGGFREFEYAAAPHRRGWAEALRRFALVAHTDSMGPRE